MIKMLKKLILAFSPRTIDDFKLKRENIDERVNKLKATLNGESGWMLEKKAKDPKTFKCDCEEL